MAEDATDPNAAAPPLPLPTTLSSDTTAAGSGQPLPGIGIAMQQLATVNTYVNDGSGGVEQASFSVDVERIPELVAQYKKARQKLQAIQRKADQLREQPRPAEDEVSQKLVARQATLAG
ncbi:hypothetical protein [Salinifilum ghardaiensis]